METKMFITTKDKKPFKASQKPELDIIKIVIRNFDKKYEIRGFDFETGKDNFTLIVFDKQNNLYLNLILDVNIYKIKDEQGLTWIFNQQIEFKIQTYIFIRDRNKNLIERLVEIKKIADDMEMAELDVILKIQMKVNVLIQNLKNEG